MGVAVCVAFAACTNGTNSEANRERCPKGASCARPATGSGDFGTSELAALFGASSIGEASDPAFPGARISLVCAQGTQIHVYEYPTEQARAATSRSIDAHGSPVGNSYIDWVGPPHFYARGRVLALVLTGDSNVNRRLTKIFGPTLTPNAGSEPAFIRSTACTT